jgi:hypothetical protein
MINPILARVQRKSTIPMDYEVFATHTGRCRWNSPAMLIDPASDGGQEELQVRRHTETSKPSKTLATQSHG